MTTNDLGQPIGFPVPGWTARQRPPRAPLQGSFARIEMLDAATHAAQLYAANAADREGRIWTYLPYGPYAQESVYRDWVASMAKSEDPLFHAIVDRASGKAVGVASYLRIDAAAGVVEVGHINYSPALQRTAAATEAMYLLMKRVFDELGYRRYEWKCDALNAPSRAAAQRLGFTYEGLFRQAAIYKGRNRDTAWYAITDKDWPKIRTVYESWLAPENFDGGGRPKLRLSAMMQDALPA
ncbi:GNAT family N-acetyltransferase [Dongia sp.]|uniref:GNAT family N-acetyltransferase n=1 Tax=Dongia sp. TaxID=1977262 RepID=UPI0035B1BE61